MGQTATNWFRRICAKVVAVPELGIGYFKADSAWVRRISAAIAPIPLFGLGYLTADPASMSLQFDVFGSPAEHGAPISGLLGSDSKAQVAHLFSTPGKGPRADFVLEEKRTMAVARQPRQALAALAPFNLDISGSPEARENLVNRSSKTGLQGPFAAEHADHARAQRGDHGSSSLFMVSLKTAATYRFSSSTTDGGVPRTSEVKLAANAPRAAANTLVFQGETESEWKTRQRRCLTTAIYFEARGEPLRGQLAVAQVIMNRVRAPGFPDTICGVVFQGTNSKPRNACQFSFACDGIADFAKDKGKWGQANSLAKKVTNGEVWLADIGHATYYHATYVKPAWRRNMNRIKKIGRHIFYLAPQKPIQEADASTTNPAPRLAQAQSG